MKALILNSGLGRRMGALTAQQPKCMTEISPADTILSRQLRLLGEVGITDIVITTGPFSAALEEYCRSLDLGLRFTFVNNPEYASTNYIYSIYLARQQLDDDILLLHGDLVFELSVLKEALAAPESCVTVSSTSPLPEKDFKAVIHPDEQGIARVRKVGIEFFADALAAQPMYKLVRSEWMRWLSRIEAFCRRGETSCYAENALNEIGDSLSIAPLDVKSRLCAEIDNLVDLERIRLQLAELEKPIAYICFSTDLIHSGHINIVDKAARLGRVVAGVLSDEVVAGYKRYPLLGMEERKNVIRHIAGVSEVVDQNTLSYADNIRRLRPKYVVHGDDWRTGFQTPIREEVVTLLNEYGGELVEYPYSNSDMYKSLEDHARLQLSIPDIRRGRLRKLIAMKGCVNAIEAHSGLTGLIAEKTAVLQDGCSYQFDAMWVSSLCDSTVKGKPDIELVDMTSRFRTIDEIMEVTTKPIIFDGDTGGLIEHFVYTVKTLERMGVSMIIIEDKVGLKKNSLFGTEAGQTQDSIENFSRKITAGKHAQKTRDFMIVARIESLILEQGMEDALSRAFAFVQAGADGIMIHSRRKEPDEIFEFVGRFRDRDKVTPVVVVPTSFNTVTEQEFKQRGVNVVIYANQLTRSGFPAMRRAAETILTHHRAKEADDACMPIAEILHLIPEEL